MPFSHPLQWLISFLLIFSIKSIEFRKRFVLEPNSYLEFQNTFIEDVEINFSSGTVKGTFTISLPADQNSQNATFDVFQFSMDDVEGILCYKRAIINGDYTADCDFLNNVKKSLLSIPIFTKHLYEEEDLLDSKTFINNYFIDNTKFPNGTFNGDKLVIDSVYSIEVESAMSYFIKTIGVAVALGVILIIFVVGLLYLMIKYKEVKKKYKEEIMSLNTNERSFVTGGHSAKKRIGSKDNKNESFEESKADSSLNNSLNRKNG